MGSGASLAANDPVLEEMDLEDDFDLDTEDAPAPKGQPGAARPPVNKSSKAAKTGKAAKSAKPAKPEKAAKPAKGKKAPKGKRPAKGPKKPLLPKRKALPPPPKKPKQNFRVEIPDLDREIIVEEGADLRTGLRANHVNLFWGPWAQAFNCRGVASCGLCKIEVLDGADKLSPRTKKEDKRLKGKPESWRLACHAKIQGSIVIEPFPRVPVESKVSEEAIRRARLSAEEREQLIEEREAQRKAEWDAKTEAGPQPKEKKLGLVSKLVAKAKGDKGDKGGSKPAKTKATKADKKPKKLGKNKAPKADSDSNAVPADSAASLGAPAASKKRFGVKGRK